MILFFILNELISIVSINIFVFTARLATNRDYSPVVGFIPFETVVHRVHRVDTDGQTLCPPGDVNRSGLDRRIAQRDSHSIAPRKFLYIQLFEHFLNDSI